MFYTIYKTTNTVNGKYYVGAHATKDPNDSYLGSGTAINKAIEKYGIDNFTKEVLFIFDNEDEMYDKESELVEVASHTYNLTPGGKGGWGHVDIWGENNPMKNPETVRRNVENRRVTDKAIAAAKRNINAAIDYNTGRKRPEHSSLMKNESHLLKMMENDYDGWRDSLGSSQYELISPSGCSIITTRVKDFCKENDIPYTTIYASVKSGKAVSKGKAKGWIAIKL